LQHEDIRLQGALRAENKIGDPISANKIGILGRKTRQFSAIFGMPRLYIFFLSTSV
jgi:hypothetical protein